ncbi:MAG: alpha/beta fold hydrolase [Gammaproteobacteria bacterium]|nr:alpha/beta fold hydrolase [Gammaproteobacteria bacterium]
MTDYNKIVLSEKRNECVVLLHGLARSSRSFSAMENALSEAGYHVINVDYPSRKHVIESLAEDYVTKAIAKCRSVLTEKIHFVTHSMGGILVRYYLANYSLDSLGHVVMLSPPNQGSEVVDKLGNFPGFYVLNGPAGQQLGTLAKSLPNKLGPVDYSVGVITGNKSINLILSTIIPGDDDGKVSIERAKVAGMSDYLVVPHTHPMIMSSKEVIRQTIGYLQNGKFYRKSATQ